MTEFYVYEYWRPDKNVCFYVGKGHDKRAWEFRRRHHCGHIIRKLQRSGLMVDVRIVCDGLQEAQALKLEIERIAMWRKAGVRLSNVTAGGEGVTGLKHSEATRALIREKRKLQIICHTEETRAKIGKASGAARVGRKNPEHSARLTGRKLSPEHKARIGESGRGRVPSAEQRAKASASNLGQKRSAEACENMRAARLRYLASRQEGSR